MADAKIISVVFLVSIFICSVKSQFPAICNTPENLDMKTCCPNDCGAALNRGNCTDITEVVNNQAVNGDSTIIDILSSSANSSQKGTIDSRYLWPTQVFSRVCKCTGNFYGADCSECAFGWRGENCDEKKPLVTRKSFSSLTHDEKLQVIEGFRMLKLETGQWAVVVEEPATDAGRVRLADTTTYDMFVYTHNFVSRDASNPCEIENNNILVDFAHSGPAFLVWHRTYLLIFERAMQRVLQDDNFGLPYWQWEENDRTPFDEEYFGLLSSTNRKVEQIISGGLIAVDNWTLVCDTAYKFRDDFRSNDRSQCSKFWDLCNPDDRRAQPIERGNEQTYLSSVREIQIGIAAPEYDTPNYESGETNPYTRNSSRDSFRSRIEGWSMICSASTCVATQETIEQLRLHNNIHWWIGGHMSIAPAAVNDPIFILHHGNVDRILESWMQRWNDVQRPPYAPVSRGHPGHNRDDYMVPFLPVITCGDQYATADKFGYKYDSLIEAALDDADIPNCPVFGTALDQCHICEPAYGCTSAKCYTNLSIPLSECSTTCSTESQQTCSSSSKITVSIVLLLSVLMLFVAP